MQHNYVDMPAIYVNMRDNYVTFNLNLAACQHYDNCCIFDRNKLHVNKSVLYTDLNHLASIGQKYATKTPNNDCRCWNLVIFTHSFKKAGMLGSVVLLNKTVSLLHWYQNVTCI